jgi:hypothetical protein
MLAVDVLPPIACHGGTRDCCSGLWLAKNSRLTRDRQIYTGSRPRVRSRVIVFTSSSALALRWIDCMCMIRFYKGAYNLSLYR